MFPANACDGIALDALLVGHPTPQLKAASDPESACRANVQTDCRTERMCIPRRSLHASASSSVHFRKLAVVLPVVVVSLVLDSPIASAQAIGLASDWLITGLEFDGCMTHADNVFRQAGFTNMQKLRSAVGAAFGAAYTAQIMCLPDKVVTFVVAGDQGAASHAANIKQLFVNLPAP